MNQEEQQGTPEPLPTDRPLTVEEMEQAVSGKQPILHCSEEAMATPYATKTVLVSPVRDPSALTDAFTGLQIPLASVDEGGGNFQAPLTSLTASTGLLWRYGPTFRRHIPKQYVLVYGHSHLPGVQGPTHDIGTVTLVQKPEGSLHAGLWNLPGGVIMPGETPAAAAVRKYMEETGVQADFPFYLGEITDFHNYVVYVFRVQEGKRITNGTHAQRQVVLRRFQWKDSFVQNLPLLLSLASTGTHHWTLVEHAWAQLDNRMDSMFYMVPALVTDAYINQPHFRESIYGSHKKRDGVEAK